MEKEDLRFVIENTNKQKIRVFFTSLIIFLIIIGLGLAIYSTFGGFDNSAKSFESIKDLIMNQVKSYSPAGLFYSGFWASLFFMPLSQELFFYPEVIFL